jgi:hypothetical protein
MKNRNEDNVVFTIIQHFTKVFSKFLHKVNVYKVQTKGDFGAFTSLITSFLHFTWLPVSHFYTCRFYIENLHPGTRQ